MASDTDKVAIITGATSSVGQATARRLATAGYMLALTGLDQGDLMELARQCQGLGTSEHRLLLLAGDLTDDKNTREVMTRTVEKFGKLDILVNNLSWDTELNEGKEPTKLYDDTMRLNVRSVFYITQLATTHLVQTQGCIINNYGNPTLKSSSEKVVYSIIKATLDHFMQSVAVDLAPKGVRINAVNPGAITDSGHCTNGQSIPSVSKKTRDGHARGKHRGKDKDVAAAIAFLASHDANMITGELLAIDSGKRIRPGAPLF